MPKLSLAEFDDVLQTRLLLEGEAAERGAHRLSEADLRATEVAGAARCATRCRPTTPRATSTPTSCSTSPLPAAASPTLLALIETVWLKVGPLSNRLFDVPASLRVLNEAHDDALAALGRRDGAAVRRAVERDLFVAGQFLRRACRA